VGGTCVVGGEDTDGSLNLAGGVGLKPEPSDPAGGADDTEGNVFWGAAGGGLKLETPGPATGPDDKNGVTAGGAAAKGVVEGLEGKLERPGFSVPMDLIKITWFNCYNQASIS
jgi:hypothetical protein